jgi:hypothetical protein
MWATTRLRIAWVSATKFSRSAAVQTSGATMSTKSWPSARSPALGRAFSMAWNSQVLAHLR